MIYVRAIHFAATIAAAGAVFFIVLIVVPVLRRDKAALVPVALRSRLKAIAWIGLALTLISGAAWLLLTAQAMSQRSLADVLSQGVLWTVLSQTEFGNAWLMRLVLALVLAGILAPLLSLSRITPRWVGVAAAVLAAALVGGLAWAGHAIGGTGVEGIVHPVADVLHLIAAAAWVGALPLFALLLLSARRGEISIAAAQAATLRFSTLGIFSVGTILLSGIVNTWYLVGNVAALVDTFYGRLLAAKIALFFAMVALAAVNRLRLTPRLLQGTTAGGAVRQLYRNTVTETLIGAVIIAIVAVLGTEPPASHAHHHPAYGALPADAAFQHIHTEQGMADVTILPGRVGTARATIRLWTGDFEPLDAQRVTFTLTPPAPGGKPETRRAILDSDGEWLVDRIDLPQPGDWTVTVDAVLGPTNRLVLAAPIVIEPGR